MGRGESEELDPEEKRQARGILETLGGRGGGGGRVSSFCLSLPVRLGGSLGSEVS